MSDNDRQAYYNGWASKKIFLEPKVEKNGESCTLSVTYEYKVYSETCYQKDMFGSTNLYNYTFNKLLTKMRGINKDIELRYAVKNEF